MKLIQELKFTAIYYDEQAQLLTNSWHDGNQSIKPDELKETISAIAHQIKQIAPVCYLADESNRQFLYTVDVQAWVAATIAEASIGVGLKRYAIVMPQDFVAQLSTEQTREEAGEVPIDVRYFQDKQTALVWLKS